MTEVFAIMDANGWSIVIGALGIVVAQVVGMILSYLRDRDKMLQLKEVKEDIKVIEKATNSLTDRLVKSTGEASFAAGADAERTRADAATPTTETAATIAADKIVAQAKIEAARLVADAKLVADKLLATTRASELHPEGPKP